MSESAERGDEGNPIDVALASLCERFELALQAVKGKQRISYDEKRELIESMPECPDKHIEAHRFRMEITNAFASKE